MDPLTQHNASPNYLNAAARDAWIPPSPPKKRWVWSPPPAAAPEPRDAAKKFVDDYFLDIPQDVQLMVLAHLTRRELMAVADEALRMLPHARQPPKKSLPAAKAAQISARVTSLWETATLAPLWAPHFCTAWSALPQHLMPAAPAFADFWDLRRCATLHYETVVLVDNSGSIDASMANEMRAASIDLVNLYAAYPTRPPEFHSLHFGGGGPARNASEVEQRFDHFFPRGGGFYLSEVGTAIMERLEAYGAARQGRDERMRAPLNLLVLTDGFLTDHEDEPSMGSRLIACRRQQSWYEHQVQVQFHLVAARKSGGIFSFYHPARSAEKGIRELAALYGDRPTAVEFDASDMTETWPTPKNGLLPLMDGEQQAAEVDLSQRLMTGLMRRPRCIPLERACLQSSFAWRHQSETSRLP